MLWGDERDTSDEGDEHLQTADCPRGFAASRPSRCIRREFSRWFACVDAALAPLLLVIRHSFRRRTAALVRAETLPILLLPLLHLPPQLFVRFLGRRRLALNRAHVRTFAMAATFAMLATFAILATFVMSVRVGQLAFRLLEWRAAGNCSKRT